MLHIAHTTDFSPASHAAFHHALCLAVASRAALDIVHVGRPLHDADWSAFPKVRQTLTVWGLLEPGAPASDVERITGVRVTKIEIARNDALAGITRYFQAHRPDLIVAATHGREGFERALHGSLSEDLIAQTRVPCLLLGPKARGFVDPASGGANARAILLPLADKPSPEHAFQSVETLLPSIGLGGLTVHLMTVGRDQADLLDCRGQRRNVPRSDGPVVETIVTMAERVGADLVVMPTAGRHGLMDAMRGSTTSQILAQSACPVLAVPMIRA